MTNAVLEYGFGQREKSCFEYHFRFSKKGTN